MSIDDLTSQSSCDILQQHKIYMLWNINIKCSTFLPILITLNNNKKTTYYTTRDPLSRQITNEYVFDSKSKLSNACQCTFASTNICQPKKYKTFAETSLLSHYVGIFIIVLYNLYRKRCLLL